MPRSNWLSGIDSLGYDVMVGVEVLSKAQRDLLVEWLPDARVVRSHGWGLIATIVLEVTHGEERFIVKAGGESDHHIGREIRAHREWLGPWVETGRAPRLVAADVGAKLLVTRFLPGELVLDTAYAADPEVFRQAGELLAALHAQPAHAVHLDPDYEADANASILGWLAKDHGIHPEMVRRVREEIASWPTPPVTLVPTHGDFQPRNWLAEGMPGGRVEVRAIDFGRAALRPAMTDFVRSTTKVFRSAPVLEAAFFDGYGSDPREPAEWRRHRVRDAVGVAVWSHHVGAEEFEALGHLLLAELMT